MAVQPPPFRSGHPYYMYDSIQHQPDDISRVLKEEAGTIHALTQTVHAAQDVHIVGIGTSWHGALVGENLLRSIGGHNARAWNSFEFSSLPPHLSNQSVVIVLSHRGTKQFSLKSLQIAKAAGAKTAILTGLNSKAQVELCDFVIRTSEQEKSSAFTMSHTSAITALLLLSISLGVVKKLPNAVKLQSEIHTLPDLVRATLTRESEVEALVKKIKDKSIFYFMGYGVNVPTAYEAALKIKEASYDNTEGFQIEQFLHGPYCARDEKTVLVFLDPLLSASGHPGSARTLELANAALAVGATVVNITAEKRDISDDKYLQMLLPHTEESFTSITYLVMLQLLTYKLALERGKNPDSFRRDDPKYADAAARFIL
eukprot:Phypoly_transcript_09270.p1 GENE.Phypoly_transcript_09270~~Phypoly_transcript_09270.p1  ORF type:complete len:371 (+),score=57.49 Phypoly_transcript_09270:60-1172(+)